MATSLWDFTTPPVEKVRCAFIGLSRGFTHVDSAANIPFAVVVAVCDIVEGCANRTAKAVKNSSGKEPAMYFGDESIWKKMIGREKNDVVYIANP